MPSGPPTSTSRTTARAWCASGGATRPPTTGSSASATRPRTRCCAPSTPSELWPIGRRSGERRPPARALGRAAATATGPSPSASRVRSLPGLRRATRWPARCSPTASTCCRARSSTTARAAPLTLRGLDANCYVQLGDEPNVPADRLPLRAGLVATGQNYRGVPGPRPRRLDRPGRPVPAGGLLLQDVLPAERQLEVLGALHPRQGGHRPALARHAARLLRQGLSASATWRWSAAGRRGSPPPRPPACAGAEVC